MRILKRLIVKLARMTTVKYIVFLIVVLALCLRKHGVEANCDRFSKPDLKKLEFYSPSYPGNYDHNMTCHLQLTAPSGYVVQVKFHTFDLESSTDCKNDYLEIKDGDSNSNTLIAKYCGKTIPPITISKGRQMHLTFRSDLSVTNSGFRASFHFTLDARCGKFSIGDPAKKEFYSPLHPSKYPDNIDCNLQLDAPTGYVVQVQFHTFDLESTKNCTNDYVEMKDGTSSSNTPIAKYCGKTIPPITSSKGRQMHLTFRSDHSLNYDGFRASYIFTLDGNCDKFSIGDLEKKEFYSPRYPSSYDNNMNCSLQLTAPSGHVIHIVFHEFQLEASHRCSLDHLEINEGNATDHTFLGEYCGQTGPQPITSTGNQLYLRFKSDGSVTYPGFRASYQFLVKGCDKFSIGDPRKNEFYSPYFPSNYDDNMNCTLHLTAPVGSKIRIEFLEFQMEISRNCASDYIQINDGNSTSGRLVGRYCGKTGPQTITSRGRELFLNFKSDSKNNFPGFRASYQFVSDGLVQLLSRFKTKSRRNL